MLLWVVDGTPLAERAVVHAVAEDFGLAVRFCAAAEAGEAMRTMPVAAVGVELAEAPAAGLAVLRALHGRRPDLPLFAAAADSGLELIGVAFEAGASDLVSLPLRGPDLHKVLLKLMRHAARPLPAQPVHGELLTVYGVRGGLGATTLAVNLAVQLAHVTQGRVALVDLDLQRGDVAAFLNLAPPQSLAALAAAGRELDATLLHTTLTRHPSGVLVLAAPTQILEADAIRDDDVAAVLRLLRAQSPYTVVDTPRALTDTTLPAFEQADRILVLTDLSVPGVRAARRVVELLVTLGVGGERLELVLTDAVAGPVSVADAVQAIGREPLITLPRDETAANQAMNNGAPLNGTRPAPLTAAVRRLAGQLTGTGGAAPRRGVLGRWFGRGRRDRP